MIKSIFSKAKTLIAAIAVTIVLCVFRVFVLLYAVDYSSGLFSREGNIYNIIYYILLAAVAVILAVAASKDIFIPKKSFKECYKSDISGKKTVVIGGAMIAVGSIEAMVVVRELAAGLNIFSLFIIAGCAGFLISGVLIASSKRISVYHSLAIIFIMASYLGQAIKFFTNNTLIAKSPQKLMYMGFLITAAFFYIQFGRTIANDKKASSKWLAVISGYFCTAMTAAYIASSFMLLAIDGEKWLRLTSIPGLTLIPAALTPAILATVILFSRKECGQNEQTERTADRDGEEVVQITDNSEAKEDLSEN